MKGLLDSWEEHDKRAEYVVPLQERYEGLIKVLIADLYRVSGSGQHVPLIELTSLTESSPGWKLLVETLK